MTIEQDRPAPQPRRSRRAAPAFAGPNARRRRPRFRLKRLHLLGGLGLVLVIGGVAAGLLLRPQSGAAGPQVPARIRPIAAAAPATPDQILETTLAPDEIRAISPDEARAFNAGLPFSDLPIQAAKPFIMPADRLEDYARALDCLTAAVYYEAASETVAGQAAVAQVVVNRMRHPAYPKTVCGVVFQGSERKTGCQFSFTCDGAMGRKPSVEGWARARRAATASLNGYVATGVGMATHYHTDWVAPYWAERLVKMRQIGTHIFYRWGGGWGLPQAFTGRHADVEPMVEKMALVASPLDPLALEDPTAALTPAPVLVSVAPLPPLPPSVLDRPAVPTSSPATPAVSAAPAPAPAVAAAAPVARPPVVANPLTSGQQRRRPRIAAPS